ncbi:type II restriction endonuclease [Mesobacillus boroniphilus]|uniref:Type II restriction endonuclease n=1 Tax=Mesobacillus boroniphilus TaxID=308892 RepID=A0A944CIH8_9BACI|nr:hypothetical protein [Mesobacillus boroniphilus]MBS8263846.1 type II restriction endonuclease [Mesobacillus boroniphilus]
MHKIFNSKLIGLVIKRLSKVEVDKRTSNQHELNGNRDLRKLLGDIRINNQSVKFTYHDRDGSEISTTGSITWYDAREAHPSRTEYRLYFKSNYVMDNANQGDLLIVSLQSDGEINIIIIQEGGKLEENLLSLFGPLERIGTTFKYRSV